MNPRQRKGREVAEVLQTVNSVNTNSIKFIVINKTFQFALHARLDGFMIFTRETSALHIIWQHPFDLIFINIQFFDVRSVVKMF